MLSSQQKNVLLIDGYLREQEKCLNLSNIIPKSIYAVIFEFQLLVEKWNKEFSSSNAVISDNGSCIDITNDALLSICGNHTVKYGECFQWKLKVIKSKAKPKQFDSWQRKYGKSFKCVIALVPNNDDLLTIEREEDMEELPKKGGYVFSAVNGYIQYNGVKRRYARRSYSFGDKGDILQIKFNWKVSKLHFIINGDDLGNCLVTWKGEKVEISNDEQLEFRLVVCVMEANGAKIMIQGEEF